MSNVTMSKQITHRLGRLALALALASLFVTPASPASAQAATCLGLQVTIFAVPGLVTNGTDLNDVILGTSGNDTINGKKGHDIICGQGGVDTIHGNTGNDLIAGGAGNDRLYGDDDRDTVNGNDGNDTMVGGNGDDSLSGGNNDDNFNCGAGADIADGGPHLVADTLVLGHGCEVTPNIP